MECEKLRRRIEYEDGMLNTRTTIFLVATTVWLPAAGIGALAAVQSYIVSAGLVLSVVWAICGFHSWRVIAALTVIYIDECSGDEVDKEVRKRLPSRKAYRFLSPTNLLALLLPGFFVICWVTMLLGGY